MKRQRQHACAHCRKRFFKFLSVKNPKYCSRNCYLAHFASQPCTKCGKKKNATDFYTINTESGPRVMSTCKQCQLKIHANKYWSDPAAAREYSKEYRTKYKEQHPERWRATRVRQKLALKKKHLNETLEQRQLRLRRHGERNKKYIAALSPEQLEKRRARCRAHQKRTALIKKARSTKRSWIVARLVTMARDDGMFDLLGREYEHGR